MSGYSKPSAFPFAEMGELRRLTEEDEKASNRLFDAVFPTLPTPHPLTLQEEKREWRALYWRRYKFNLRMTVFLFVVYLALLIVDIRMHDWIIFTFNVILIIFFPVFQLVVLPSLSGIWKICPYLPGYKKRYPTP